MIFTAAATALLSGTFLAGSAIATSLVAGGLSLAASVGVSYAAQALSGNSNQTQSQSADSFGVQGQLQGGGDVPRSFPLGAGVTAGSLVYANTWAPSSAPGQTPNAYLVQVIALADVPGAKLTGMWVNGEKVTIPTMSGAPGGDDPGYQIPEYIRPRNPDFPDDLAPHLYVKYYDGSQTTADPWLTGSVSTPDRPYEGTRVGKGVSYVMVTALTNDFIWTGFPTFKFEMSGIPLYDPTKDSTNGGSGAHRWSDPSTWGGDGDDLPAVQAYNIMRGVYVGGQWLYGLQRMTQARLPAINWNAQIAKCRATITGASGVQPTYRAGGQVTVDAQVANTLEALMTACQGRISEIGGFYKVRVGAPDSPTFAWTDDDILSTEEQTFTPFFGLADSINGITASYPSPAEGWETKVAPPRYNAGFEAEDGNRRLLANPTFDFVPYDEQVQRLQKSALQEARRARRHTLVLPPAFWLVEPGDVGEWSSVRNGYDTKQFRVDGMIDKANLDVVLDLTEVDPNDYDWDPGDFTPVGTGPTIIPYPAPQGVVDWFAEPYTLFIAGQPRRPAIRLSWDGSIDGVVGVKYEVRLAADESDVTRGRTDQLQVGSIIVSQSIIANGEYEVRGQYIPSAPREMLWSDWLVVTAPDVKLTLADFDQSVVDMVTAVTTYNDEPLKQAQNLIRSTIANQDARNWDDIDKVSEAISVQADTAAASIEEVKIVAVDTQTAFANFTATATATWGSLTAFVETSASAIATLDGYAAAEYAITLDVNGYAVGFNLLNGGGGISAATFTVDKFQIAFPGVTGGAAVPVFTVANVAGTPKVALRGDMIVDGSVTTQKMSVGSLTAITAHFGDATVDGALTSTNGKMLIDFSNGNIIISD